MCSLLETESLNKFNNSVFIFFWRFFTSLSSSFGFLFQLTYLEIKLLTILFHLQLLVVIDLQSKRFRSRNFTFSVFKLSKIFVIQALLNSRAFVWIKLEAPLHKINSVRIAFRITVFQALWLNWRHIFNHLHSKRRVKWLYIFRVRLSSNLQNQIYLVCCWCPWEHWSLP